LFSDFLRGERFIPTGVGNASGIPFHCGGTAVHPHGCGERLDLSSPPGIQSGSSPRVWGTPVVGKLFSEGKRFIPTGVGNAVPARLAILRFAVHPHGCGERSSPTFRAICDAGSSPRVWGTPPPRMQPRAKTRFIPTGVGNALHPIIAALHKAVHPHGCGERCWPGPIHIYRLGSSPRVWGTPPGPWFFFALFTVHPHGCGERDVASIEGSGYAGSSPRVWGTLRTSNAHL